MLPPTSTIYSNTVVRLVPADGIQVREDVSFSDAKGAEKPKLRKQKTKLLKSLQPALRKLLQPGEAVFWIARAQSPMTTVEQLSASAFTYYHTMCALVVTNRRMLHIPINNKVQWRRSARAAAWGDVAEVRVKGWLIKTLNLKYRDGQKEVYRNLVRADASKLKALLPILADPQTAEISNTGNMASICPECLASLTPSVYRCEHCGLTFKDEKTMVQRSAIIPAGAYFYTGHPLVGTLFAFVELILLFDLILGLATRNWDLAVTAAIVLAVEKLFTIYHARRFIREFIPIEGSSTAAIASSAGGTR